MRRVRDSIASFKSALKERQQQAQLPPDVAAAAPRQTDDNDDNDNDEDDAPPPPPPSIMPLPLPTQQYLRQQQVAARLAPPISVARQNPPSAVASTASARHDVRSSALGGRAVAAAAPTTAATTTATTATAAMAAGSFFRESPSRVTKQMTTLDVSDGALRSGLFSFGKRSATFKRRFQQVSIDTSTAAAAVVAVAATAGQEIERVVKRRAVPAQTPLERFRAAFDADEHKRRLRAAIAAAAAAPPPPSGELVKQGIAVGAQWTLARRQLQQSLSGTQRTMQASLAALVDAQTRLQQQGSALPRASSATLPSFDAWRRQCR